MPNVQRKHASREEAEKTRRTILRVAQELFMKYGYCAVTTRRIADACGLTQPALYHYFGDKQSLYVTMALEELAKTKAALERILHRNEEVEELLNRVALYLVASTQYDINPLLHAIRYELAPEAQSMLNNAAAYLLLSLLSNIVTRNKISDRPIDNGDQVKLVLRVLLYGLANSAT